MSLPNATKPILAGGATTAYQVSRSLRFNSADSAYLTRTFSTPTTQGTFTLSLWAKLSSLGTTRNIFGVSTNHSFKFTSGNALNLTFAGSSALTTTALFRDPSAWHHIVWTQSGTSHTLYMNNVSVGTATATSNAFNTAVAHQLGAANTANYFNGYLSEIYFIDGQALTPSSFAQTDATTGQWVPKTYAGTYGTNGFKLNFSDNSAATAATLGADSSGNGNNFTPTNLSVTAGVGNDSLTDTPTQYGSDTGAGGEVRGNYCTLNPLSTTSGTFTQGNLRYTGPNTWGRCSSTVCVSTGKWYWEVTLAANPSGQTSGAVYHGFGFALSTAYASTDNPTAVTDAIMLADTGWYKNFSGANTNALGTFVSGSVLSIAVDLDLNTFTFRHNNSSLATGTIGGTVGRELSPVVCSYNTSYGVMDCNFGQRAFAYAAPSGYKALCVQNLSTPTIVLPSTAFDAKLYTGTGSSQSITGLGFNPDLVWIKSRSAATDNTLYDSVRGVQTRLESNNVDVEATSDAGLTAFNATGFTVNTLAQVNTSAATYVGWCWDESVSAGFDIVTYTGDMASNRDVAHSLGVAPKFIIIKDRSSNMVNNNWSIWHTSMTSGHNIYFDTAASFAVSGTTYGGIGTAHTSSTFRLQNGFANNLTVNESGDSYVAYLWADVAGFSKFGSYTGNGASDGPFVHCGFRPRFILMKRTDSSSDWRIHDTARATYNVESIALMANASSVEDTGANLIDELSNGFKCRDSGAFNTSAATYIFMAFAEAPFKYSNAR